MQTAYLFFKNGERLDRLFGDQLEQPGLAQHLVSRTNDLLASLTPESFPREMNYLGLISSMFNHSIHKFKPSFQKDLNTGLDTIESLL